MRGNVRQRLARIEAAVEHDQPAFLQGHQRRHIQPADVKDRRRGQGYVVFHDVERMHGVGVVPPEITMRQHRAFRPAGGAGGVHDHRDVVGARRDVSGRGRIAVAPKRLILGGKERRDADQLVLDRGNRRPQLRVDDQHRGSAVIDHESKFRPGQPEVQRHEDGAQAQGGKHGKQKHRLVEADKCHAVAFADPERAQPRGAVLDAALHLAVGPAFSLETQRQPFGRAQRPLQKPIGQSDIRRHVFLPIYCQQAPLADWRCSQFQTRGAASLPYVPVAARGGNSPG